MSPRDAPSRGAALCHGSARLPTQPVEVNWDGRFSPVKMCSLSGASPHQVRAGSPTFHFSPFPSAQRGA